jgi:hypothetical protein
VSVRFHPQKISSFLTLLGHWVMSSPFAGASALGRLSRFRPILVIGSQANMSPLPSRNAIARLMGLAKHTACPCHACRSGNSSPIHATINQFCKFARPVGLAPEREYAFEVAASNLRFGQGVVREVGMDFANMKAKKVRHHTGLAQSETPDSCAEQVGVLTDPNVLKLPIMAKVRIPSS